jgi:signal transduction histidine kinase
MMAPSPPTQYLFDGGQSRAIRSSLQTIVEDNRAASAASFAVALYRPRGENLVVLAATGNDLELFSENEPVIAGTFPRGRRPARVDGFTIRSLLRNRSVELPSSIILPFSDEYGTGAVVVGNPSPQARPDVLEATRESLTIANAIRTARQVGAFRLQRDLSIALNAIAAANISISDPELRLQNMLQSGRSLLGSDVSYLATAEDSAGVFTFSQTLGIRTRGFKSLRVEDGHGLGGLARILRKPVRSINYSNDARLQSAPVAETRKEGILSAMAAPLMVEDHVAAVIYLADRRLRAYSPTDEALLNEFAGFAALAIEQNQMDVYRERQTLRRYREEMAYSLHDTVVRRLVEIGFVVEEGGRDPDFSTSQQRFQVIAHAVESAMDALREQISDIFAEEVPVQEVNAYEVMNRIMELRHSSTVARTHGENIDSKCSNLSATSAAALVRIGQEAIVNAERHSGCANIHVQLDTDDKTATLSVQDDGRGMSLDDQHRSAQSRVGHLGLRGMQDAANSVGGLLSFQTAAGGGLIVTAKVSRHESRNRL